MLKKQKDPTIWLQTAVMRLTKAHFWLVAAYAVVVMASDAWNLIDRELVWQRWLMAGIFLVVNTLVWYASRANTKAVGYYRALVYVLIMLDIALATFSVYSERGMASNSVMLYTLPIAVSAALLNRSAIFSTAALSTAFYTLATTRYFYVYFNEGLKIELYATLAMYCSAFFVLAAFLWITVRAKFD